MKSQKVVQALNEQINKEFYSSYLYLSMSTYFEELSYGGFAHWLKKHSEEEYGHAMKIYKYLVDSGGKVELKTIDAPEKNWDSPLAVFKAALDHEKFVSESINQLVSLCIDEKDFPTNIFLHWFVMEQVEEEKVFSDIVDKFEMLGDNKSAVYLLNKELGRRE